MIFQVIVYEGKCFAHKFRCNSYKMLKFPLLQIFIERTIKNGERSFSAYFPSHFVEDVR